jgi:Protein of unknown function (DUF993)
MSKLYLPTPRGFENYAVKGPADFSAPDVAFNRIAFAAGHVVADPLADNNPWLDEAIDWDKTLAFRHHLWSHGFAVAEAMDTAQRGMGLSFANALELITRSVKDAKSYKGAVVYSGVGTDHLAPDAGLSLQTITDAYLFQLDAVQKAGSKVILMASRALAAVATRPEDYVKVYSAVLQAAEHPVILHWLGDMFDPALAGYWGSREVAPAMDTCLAVINDNIAKVDGIKISLLSKEHEINMRRILPPPVLMYTGDDFNYAELIGGDEKGFSHALLGIFDAIAPAASAALKHLAAGNRAMFESLLEPTVPLSRHIFKAPTRFYKTGVVFLAYVNGHQDHFTMLGGQQSARSTQHFADLFRLADKAGLITDVDRAVQRMKTFLSVQGATG